MLDVLVSDYDHVAVVFHKECWLGLDNICNNNARLHYLNSNSLLSFLGLSALYLPPPADQPASLASINRSTGSIPLP